MDSGAAATQYSQLLDCMCSWGQAADILELITDWLTEALPKQGVSQYNIKGLKLWYCRVSFFFVNVIFLSTSGQGEHQSKGAYPGDGGGQTRPGTGLPGVPVQPHFNTGESPGSWSETAEAAPYSSRKLEGALDTTQQSVFPCFSTFIFHFYMMCDFCLNSRCCTIISAPPQNIRTVPVWRQHWMSSCTTAVLVHICNTMWVFSFCTHYFPSLFHLLMQWPCLHLCNALGL